MDSIPRSSVQYPKSDANGIAASNILRFPDGGSSLPLRPPLLVNYGRDLKLMQIRCWILEASGYRVRIVGARADDSLFQESADLLILCHTLSLFEVVQCLQLAHRHSYSAKVLALRATHPVTIDLPVATFNTMEGPKAFLAMLADLLRDNTEV